MQILVGDRIAWDAPQFSGGSFFRGRCRGAKFTGTLRFSGVVERDSYGKTSGQHTFSVRLDDGSLKTVKGRNLYGNLVSHVSGADSVAEADAKDARIAAAQATGERLPARMRAV